MSEITLPRSPSSSPPHFFPFFQRIHSFLSLSLFLLFFFPHPAPNSGRLSLKIFCWSSRDGVVSSAAFQLISSLPFNREQRGANRRRGGREGGGGSSIGEIGFFSFFFLFLRGKPGLLKDSASRIGGVNAGLMGNFWWPGNDNENAGAWLVGIEDGRINRVDGRWWFLWINVFGPIFFYSRLYFLTFSRYLSLRLGMYNKILCVFTYICNCVC